MTYYLNYLKDTIGNNYLGINIYLEIAQPFLNELKEIIGEEDFKIYTDNQKKRDHGHYHITVINVMDYNKLSKEEGVDKFVNSLEPIFKYEIDDLRLMGIGTATKNENRAYFVVCESDKLDAIRTRYNLPKQDFHITLGFKWKDVFGVPKKELISKKDKFLKLLEIEHYNVVFNAFFTDRQTRVNGVFKNSVIISSKLNNFYLSDSISKASPTMAKCSKQLLSKDSLLI
jgi:hypothetical protein